MSYHAPTDNAALLLALHFRRHAEQLPTDGGTAPGECPRCGPVGKVKLMAKPYRVTCRQCGMAGPRSETPRAAVNLWRLYIRHAPIVAAPGDDGD